MQFNFASSHDVKIGSAGTVTVDTTRLNADVLAHVMAYGFKQLLNDARSAAKGEEEAMALVEKKLAALYAGNVRASGERETDPVKAEAKKIATAKVLAALKKKGLKKDELPEGKFVELVRDLAAREDTVAVAKANVEAAKGLEVDEDILGDL